MKIIFLSFFMFVGFLQAQTVVENFTQKTPLVVLPDILVKRDTIFYSNNNLNKNEKTLFEQFFREFKDNINIKYFYDELKEEVLCRFVLQKDNTTSRISFIKDSSDKRIHYEIIRIISRMKLYNIYDKRTEIYLRVILNLEEKSKENTPSFRIIE